MLNLKCNLLNLKFIALSVLIIFFSSCSNQDKCLLLEELGNNLEKSNEAIKSESIRELFSLKERLKSEANAYEINKWVKIADSVFKRTHVIVGMIESIKDENKTENERKRKIKELYKPLKDYREYLLSIDSFNKTLFIQRILVADTAFDKKYKNENEFGEVSLKGQSSSEIRYRFIKLINDIRLSENFIIGFCNNKGRYIDDFFTMISSVISQNTSHLKSGEELIVKAGIGAFSKGCNPTFKIDGKDVAIDEYATALYKLKVNKGKGTYKIPVEIEYSNKDGIRNTLLNYIEYTVNK